MEIIKAPATLPPALEHDAMMAARHGSRIRAEGRLERLVFWNVCAHLAANGWQPFMVYDGDDETKVSDAKAAMELAFNLDECHVHFRKGKARHSVFFVFGNDGPDVIADWRYSDGDADGFNATLEAFDADAVIAECTTAALALAAAPRRAILFTVHGRRWFQKSAGNTYCSASASVYFSDGTSESVTVPRQYGYGDFYLQAATDALERAGFLPGREHYPRTGGAEPLHVWCTRNGARYESHASDVARERDL